MQMLRIKSLSGNKMRLCWVKCHKNQNANTEQAAKV